MYLILASVPSERKPEILRQLSRICDTRQINSIDGIQTFFQDDRQVSEEDREILFIVSRRDSVEAKIETIAEACGERLPALPIVSIPLQAGFSAYFEQIETDQNSDSAASR